MRRWLGLMLLLLITGSVQAAERAQIGLVLSGGGARGIAHIGVLKVLEEWRIPIDVIAGTSMGAIVGGAYAAGVPVEEMEQLIGELDWADLFRDAPPREHFSYRRKRDQRDNLFGSVGLHGTEVLLPEGAISGQKLDLFLRDLVARADAAEHFDELPIPFRAVATDLLTGEPLVFADGPLETALRASMSIPGLIAPIAARDTLLVDGGLVRNLPVDIVRDLGADIIIAVNLGTPLLEREQLQSALGVTVQMIAILTEQNVQRSLAELDANHDILILPQLGEITAADFQRGAEAIRIGVAAAEQQAERLTRLSLPPAEYTHWQARLQHDPVEPVAEWVIDEIRIEGAERSNPRVLRELLTTQEGESLDTERLRSDLQRVFGRDDFDRVSYRLQEEDEHNVLIIDVAERSWGPNYLRLGLRTDIDFKGNNDYRLALSYLRTWINPLGAEWQTDLTLGEVRGFRSKFYQPLDVTQRWFIAPFMGYQERDLRQFDGGQQVADHEITTTRLGIDVGVNRRDQGQWRFRTQLRHLDTARRVGLASPSEGSLWQAGVGLRYSQDQLDNLAFPGRGRRYLLSTEFWQPLENTDSRYARAQLDWRQAFSHESHRWQTRLQLGARVGSDLPLADQFTLGGFQRLSGLRPGQLRGQYMALGQAAYYRPVARFGGAFGGDIFAGGSVELGQVWQHSRDIRPGDLDLAASVFLGLDSFLGPLYFGYGQSERGNDSFYLLLGVPR
jgi:NTE family protein